MSVYDDAYNLRYTSSTLRNRATVAIAKAGIDVKNEDAGTTNHTNRLLWAEEALVNTKALTEKMMWAILADSTVREAGNASTDAQVQNAVNAVIDTFATGV